MITFLETVLQSADSGQKTQHYSHHIPKLDFWDYGQVKE